MIQNIKTLNSKLSMPIFPDAMKRNRLLEIVKAVPEKRITTVIASAGYGKTTLISQACLHYAYRCLWYQIDNTDGDFLTFLTYLIAGFQKHYPEFGGETVSRIESACVLSREKQDILTFFLSEIESTVNDELVIVLDDYHLVHGNKSVSESMKFLIDRLPTQVHFVIISRMDTGLPFSRLRAMGELLDITESDLSFNTNEIEILYTKLFNISINNETLKTLYQKFGGWAVGLIFFYHSLRGKNVGEIQLLLSKLEGSHHTIFLYLEENVYHQLSVEHKNFLIKTSILSKLEVNFCNKFLNIDNSLEILMNLEKSHLFVIPIDENRTCYQYHDLFRDFLRTRLEYEIGKKRMSQLHEDAARLYEEIDDIEEALDHYLASEKIEDVCRILGCIGRRLIWKGRLEHIESYLSKVPKSFFDQEPWIQYMKAQVLDLRGRFHLSIQIYKKALEKFQKQKSNQGETLCLMEMGRNYFHIGDLQNAEDILKKLLNQETLEQLQRLETLGQLIFTSAYLGKMNQSDAFYSEALSLLPEEDLHRRAYLSFLLLSHSYRYHFSGDYDQALEIGEKARRIFEEMKIYKPLALYYQMAANTYWHLGDFSKGMEIAKKGLKIVEENGYKDSHAWFLVIMGCNAYCLGKTSEVAEYGKRGLEFFQDIDNRQGQAACHLVLQEAYYMVGDYKAAFESVQKGFKIIEGLNLPMIRGELDSRMAVLLIEKGQYKNALPFIEDAEKNLASYKWYTFIISCIRSRFHWQQKQKKPAMEKLMTALSICRENHYDRWLIKEEKWVIPLLVDIFKKDRNQPFILSILEKMGPKANADLRFLKKAGQKKSVFAASDVACNGVGPETPELIGQFFGEFKITVDGKKLSYSDWKSKKSLMLFKYLLYFRSKGYIKKDVLMEMLWPDEDPLKTTNRFYVAMTMLRKTLEPGLEKRGLSSYLLCKGDAYRIDIGANGLIDAEKFIEELNRAKKKTDKQKALKHFRAAASLYKGEFLKEDRYVEWCDEERRWLKNQYLVILSEIISYYETKMKFKTCIAYSEKYLKADKYDEKIYQKLMEYYAFTGNKTMVTKIYEQCKYDIQKGLAASLSEETERLFRKLVSTN